MREVDITDAELLAKASHGADLTKEEKARLAQISGEPEVKDEPATEPKPKRAYRKRQS